MTMSIFSTVVAATGVGGNPNPSGLPGSTALESLISGLAFWALLAALGGLLISAADRKSTRLNSSHVKISYAVFCLKKKKKEPIATLAHLIVLNSPLDVSCK